jgi:DNA helicase II / ATP-dependent DNA helicase PcrA
MWSEKQEAVFNFVANGKGSAIVEAVAGAGKTTTIVEACNRIPSNQSVLFTAYNKAIADELKTRVPAHVEARTFHSLGAGALFFASKNLGVRVSTDANNVRNTIRASFPENISRGAGAAIAKLVSLAKQYGVGILCPNNADTWNGFVERFEVEADDESISIATVIDAARTVFDATVQNFKRTGVHDFDDMIFLPLAMNLYIKKYDWVFVDEAQDTNPARRALAKKALKPGGRLIAVGDPRQAIYGFTGADSDALELIAREFNAVTLPLTVSYRCPRAVVEAAREFNPAIESSPTADAGSVTLADKLPIEALRDEDAILCRFNAPLVELAYTLIASGRGCRIQGRDIGAGLVKLVDKMRAKNVETLIERLNAWKTREIEAAMAKGNERVAESIEDRAACLMTVIDRLPENDRSIACLKRTIEGMFADSEDASLLTLSSIHKAKGREWNRVYIIDRNRVPSPFARQDWQYGQEINLLYVAYTRAKRDLVVIG